MFYLSPSGKRDTSFRVCLIYTTVYRLLEQRSIYQLELSFDDAASSAFFTLLQAY